MSKPILLSEPTQHAYQNSLTTLERGEQTHTPEHAYTYTHPALPIPLTTFGLYLISRILSTTVPFK